VIFKLRRRRFVELSVYIIRNLQCFILQVLHELLLECLFLVFKQDIFNLPSKVVVGDGDIELGEVLVGLERVDLVCFCEIDEMHDSEPSPQTEERACDAPVGPFVDESVE
jgi:hypothetical protein